MFHFNLRCLYNILVAGLLTLSVDMQEVLCIASLPVFMLLCSKTLLLAMDGHRRLHNGIIYTELLKLFVEQVLNFLLDLDCRNMVPGTSGIQRNLP